MNESVRITVAVDGPAGSGKSSVCRRVAVDLGIKYIDSGALYRAVTYYFLKKYGSVDNVTDIKTDLYDINLIQNFRNDGTVAVILNGHDVSREIRDERITGNIGFFSDKPVIRDFVNAMLRGWSHHESIIMDGRDIGSIVFPHADVKIYLDASVQVRADRRVKEYVEMGKNVDENSIRNQIIQRDFEDMNRKVGPLKRVDDAIYIDTSELPYDSVVEHLKNIINDFK